MTKRNLWILCMVLLLCGAFGQAVAQESEVQKFYKGKAVDFIVPYSPGGTYDLWARVLAPKIEQLTGARVLVKNMPGAGGLVGTGHLYNVAKPDGLTFGIFPMPGLVLAEMLDLKSVQFELEKFTFLARIEDMERSLFASKTSGFKTLSDLQKATKTVRFGTVDPTSASTVDSALLAEGFGIKAKIIPGYKGSKEYMLAMISGKEVDVAATTTAGYSNNVKSGDISLIAALGKKRNPDFPDVPTALENPALSAEGKKRVELITVLVEAGRMLLAPPGVPADKSAYLERVVLESMKNPEVIEWAKKNGYNLAPLNSRECKELIDDLFKSIPSDEKPKIKHIVTEKYF